MSPTVPPIRAGRGDGSIPTQFDAMTNLEDIEALLCAKLDALGPAQRVELLRVLMPPDFDRAGTASSMASPEAGCSRTY